MMKRFLALVFLLCAMAIVAQAQVTISGGRATVTSVNGSTGDVVVNGEQLLATVTLNVNAGGKQALYTVPAGKHCIITKVIYAAPSVDLSAGFTASISHGFNAGASDWLSSPPPLASLDNSSKFVILSPVFNADTSQPGSGVIGNPADVFGARGDTPYGSSATVTVYVFGILY